MSKIKHIAEGERRKILAWGHQKEREVAHWRRLEYEAQRTIVKLQRLLDESK
ncbi:MAG: hypothetical protein ACTSV6_05545 [Candidatus Heimdallarchaeota archaeon]